MSGRTAPQPIRPFSLDFGPLVQLRRFRGYTQAEVARAAGIHPITLWRLENNKHKSPSLKQLIAIGRALGVPYGELYVVTEATAV
ncbi:MAG: helix-turn-helix transcriptional regulator [Verrucomicrobiota bacterium]